MKIKLTNENKSYLIDLAKKRHDAKSNSFRNANIERFHNEAKQKISDEIAIDKQYMPHYIGIVGEFAWAEANNLHVDEEIYKVRDSGQDFNGVEVKTITYMGSGEPELKITEKEYEARTPPQLYVLVRFDASNNEAEILGTITRESFDEVKKKKRYGIGKPYNFIVPLSKMKKFE